MYSAEIKNRIKSALCPKARTGLLLKTNIVRGVEKQSTITAAPYLRTAWHYINAILITFLTPGSTDPRGQKLKKN